MKSLLCLAILLGCVLSYANTLSSLKISGEKKAEISFQYDAEALPQIKVEGNTINLTFLDSTVEEATRAQAEKLDSHPLVKRVSLYSPDPGVVKSRILVNGSTEDLASRVRLTKEKGGARVVIDYPAVGSAAALGIMNDEEKLLGPEVTRPKASESRAGAGPWVMITLVIGLAGAGTYFFVRFAKGKTSLMGPRKHLIEPMGYYAIQGKSGVSLVKVGNEFVLLGVTPTQVTLLSQLPKLEAQYEQDSKLERNNFRTAVEEEYQKLQKKRVASV